MFTPVIVNGVHIRSLVSNEPMTFYSKKIAEQEHVRVTTRHRDSYKAQWGE